MSKLKQQAAELAARAAADAEEAAQFRARAEREYNEVAQELEQERQQAAKLQTLYTQTQAALEASDAKVAQLSKQLQTAQDTADNLRRDMRNLQVRTLHLPPARHLTDAAALISVFKVLTHLRAASLSVPKPAKFHNKS